jgi:hypothetical protein
MMVKKKGMTYGFSDWRVMKLTMAGVSAHTHCAS